MMLKDIVQYPFDAQSDSFFCALSSALLPALGYTENTPYFCAPKGQFCLQCGACGDRTTLQKHHLSIYHALLAASGVAFCFDYPQDDGVAEHSFPGAENGWRWPEAFVDFLMRFAGVSWKRLKKEDGEAAIYAALCASVEAGIPSPVRLGGDSPFGRATAWQVVTGCEAGALQGLDAYGHSLRNAGACYDQDGRFMLEDWYSHFEDALVITGHASQRLTYSSVLARIASVLADPSHERLEREILSDLDAAAPETAFDIACKLIGITSVPIEARWHAAEAFCTRENLIWSLEGDEAVKRELGELFFARYIQNDNGETHGICWRIWNLLGASAETGFGPAPDSGERLLAGNVQGELKALFAAVFQNDQEILNALRRALAKEGMGR